MAKKIEQSTAGDKAAHNGDTLREPAEKIFAREIEALIAADKDEAPPGWKMSPRAVLTYICGGTTGTTKVVQGTAGTTEEQVRYTWNYAMLIARGPSREALVRSPILRAMETGSLARFEEITRCASEVQDAMISLLSEKRISIPELETEVPAKKGFSVIATANTRDRGVNDMSAALKRRFNIVVLPTPKTIESEIDIVGKRVRDLTVNLGLKARIPAADAIEKVVTIFRELRTGQTLDGKSKLKTPSGVLSTAEAISVLANSMALAGSFGSGEVTAQDLAAALQGSVVRDEEKDRVVWQEYLSNVLKKRGSEWRPLFNACSEHND